MRRRTYLSCPRALLSEIASVIFAGEGLGAGGSAFARRTIWT